MWEREAGGGCWLLPLLLLLLRVCVCVCVCARVRVWIFCAQTETRIARPPKLSKTNNTTLNTHPPPLPQQGNYKTLSLPLLRGLARLLELLSDWFNLALGEKLVDHLKVRARCAARAVRVLCACRVRAACVRA